MDVIPPSVSGISVWHFAGSHGWVLEGVKAIDFRKASGLLGFFRVNPAGEVTGPTEPA